MKSRTFRSASVLLAGLALGAGTLAARADITIADNLIVSNNATIQGLCSSAVVVVGSQLRSGGGDTRGTGAVDLQTVRTYSFQVAHGDYSALLGGSGNSQQGYYGVIAGGTANGLTGSYSVIVGGQANVVATNHAFLGGGANNRVYGSYGVVGGGYGCEADGLYAAVLGGYNNRANYGAGAYGFVGGGYANTANGYLAVVAGGYQNSETSWAGTIGGGANNSVTGPYGTVPGGSYNSAAGYNSLAAGYYATAQHDGCFVWADLSGSTFTSTTSNQLLVRASGGVGIGTNNPAVGFHVATTARFDQVVLLIKPAGDLSMGVYTNGP